MLISWPWSVESGGFPFFSTTPSAISKFVRLEFCGKRITVDNENFQVFLLFQCRIKEIFGDTALLEERKEKKSVFKNNLYEGFYL